VHPKEAFSLAASNAAMAELAATGRQTVVLVGFETEPSACRRVCQRSSRGVMTR
jgi:hypothetical protein